MNEEGIKESFSKVKQDIFSLGNELRGIKLEMANLKTEIKLVSSFLTDLKVKIEEITPKIIPTDNPTHPEKTPTNAQITPTQEEIPTDKLLSYVLKRQNTHISTGNDGVPTDKQTNRQTNQQIIQHMNFEPGITHDSQLHTTESSKIDIVPTTSQNISHLDKAADILNSLDALKKEVRLKFKRLTSQEIVVFSMLYSLEEQGREVDYKLISEKLKLSESSIRDYIIKIQKKGVPIIKEKLNNKRIILHISQDLKRIASLDTILKLREL